jgi:hypothetical protein
MAKKKYIISLTTEERETLEQLTTTGKAPAYKMNHAQILLQADTKPEGGGWTDKAISQALDCSAATIERVRQRFVETNLETALSRQVQQQRKPRRLDGEQEAHLIAIIYQVLSEFRDVLQPHKIDRSIVGRLFQTYHRRLGIFFICLAS